MHETEVTVTSGDVSNFSSTGDGKATFDSHPPSDKVRCRTVLLSSESPLREREKTYKRVVC